MTRFQKALAVTACLILTFVVAVFLLFSELRFYSRVYGLNSDLVEDPTSSRFDINTYTDEVSSEAIGRCYYSACSRLDGIRGHGDLRTYAWEDQITFPRVSTVLQGSAGYIEVRAAMGNDSDSVSVTTAPGLFSFEGKQDVRQLPDYTLPSGTLRYQAR